MKINKDDSVTLTSEEAHILGILGGNMYNVISYIEKIVDILDHQEIQLSQFDHLTNLFGDLASYAEKHGAEPKRQGAGLQN